MVSWSSRRVVISPVPLVEAVSGSGALTCCLLKVAFVPPVECAGLGLFLWLARILSGSGPWLPLVHAQPQSLLGWHTPLAGRGRRTVSTTTHQNLQEACMHYCDGIEFVTCIRAAARARNLVLRVLWFRLEWHKHAPRHDRQQAAVLCKQREMAHIRLLKARV